MSADTLIGLLPDLVLLVSRDGTILAHGGGDGVPDLKPAAASTDGTGVLSWSEEAAATLRQIVRRSISVRGNVEAPLRELGRQYTVRANAVGPDRAIVMIRLAATEAPEDATETTGDRPRPELDRRGFLRRFKESMSVARLRESPLAVAVIHIDGIADIAQVIAPRLSEAAMSAALLRLSAFAGVDLDGQRKWYLGQIGENTLAMVIDSASREDIEACVSRVCASLREPLAVGDAEFQFSVRAGAAIMGIDGSAPKVLLEQARAAATEARHAASDDVFFHSDTIQLRSLARIDMAHEMQEAIENGELQLRYVSRHDLRSGRIVAWVAYLKWDHRLRGEIPAREFLLLAQSTGLSLALSRAALERLCADFPALTANTDADTRVSFGPLRDHVLHEEFQADIERVIEEGRIPAKRLEVRISEKAFLASDASALRSIRKIGARLVVDEVGRDLGSLASLARAPLWGMQLDRGWITAIRGDDVARSVCRAGLSVATALGLAPIAMGVDSAQQRDTLLEMGFRYGTGDLYSVSQHDITAVSSL